MRVIDEKRLAGLKKSGYMSAPQRAFFRKLLQIQYEDCLKRMDKAKGALHEHERTSDMLDAARDEEDFRALVKRIDIEQRHLKALARALQRLEKRQYGYCLETGEPIGLERLISQPTAEYCHDIQHSRERRALNYAR